MKKKILIGALVICLICLITAGLYVYSRFIAPNNYRVTYYTIDDDDLAGFNILYLSDLSYGEFYKQENLDKLSKELSVLDYDLVIYSGNLFEKAYQATSNDVTILTDFFTNLKAKSGKFALMGEYDVTNTNRELLVSKILYDSDFENFSGLKKVHLNNSVYFNMYGYNYSDTIETLKSTQLTLAFITSVEMYSQINTNVDYCFASGNLDRQINLPWQDYEYKLGNNSFLYLSSGLGLSQSQYRLFNDPEIILISFK